MGHHPNVKMCDSCGMHGKLLFGAAHVPRVDGYTVCVPPAAVHDHHMNSYRF